MFILDYNQNNIFDTAEKIVTKTVSTWTTHTVTFTIPNTALLGNARLRVRISETFEPPACTNASTWGETEDYLVNILEPCPNALVYGPIVQPPGTYKAAISIESQANVSNGTIYQAANYILLKNGFNTSINTTFTARIGGCN